MKYRVRHQTAYRYAEPASLSQNELYLHPRETGSQQLLESRLSIVPEPQYQHRRKDYFGNIVHVFLVQQPHRELSITATSLVATSGSATPQPDQTPSWESAAGQLADHTDPGLLMPYQFVFASPLVAATPATKAYAQSSFPPGRPLLEAALELTARIFNEFTYDKAATTVDTAVDQVLASRKGVCQDFAHLAISCLRSLGLAARYVSGYLETKPPPGKPKLIGADASHAWFSLFVPGWGWIDLDPTNNLIPSESHITVAWGRDYGDVTPVKGIVMGGGSHTLAVKVDITAQG